MTEQFPALRGAGAAPRVGAPGVVVDLTRHTVVVDGEPVPLTYREFELLRAVVTSPGRTLGRDELVGTSPDASAHERSVDAAVRRIRAKLDPYRDVIRSVRGSGYRFDPHADVRVID